MPSFGLWEFVLILALILTIGISIQLLPWLIAGFINAIKKHL